MKKENFDLVLQVGTTLILAYVSLGGSANNPLDEDSVLKTCLQVKLYAAPFLCSRLLFRSTPSVFLPTMKVHGITTLSTTMLQTPTSLSHSSEKEPFSPGRAAAGSRPSLAPGEEWLLRISPPQNSVIGGRMHSEEEGEEALLTRL